MSDRERRFTKSEVEAIVAGALMGLLGAPLALAACGGYVLDVEQLGGTVALTGTASGSDGRYFGDCTVEGSVVFDAVTRDVATGTGVVHDSTRVSSSLGESLRNRIDTIPVVLRVVSGDRVRLELHYSRANQPAPLILTGSATAGGYGGDWTCQTSFVPLSVTGTWRLGRT